MFNEVLNTDFTETIKTLAKQYMTQNIQESYYPQLAAVIEKYIREQDLIVSDLQMLKNEPPDPFRIYNVYCLHPYKHAIMLANRIHSDIGKWVRMDTKITHLDLNIQYNFRDIVHVYGIGTNTLLNSLDYIKPVRNIILYLPPEIEIIDVYHRLYLPNNYEERDELRATETKLFSMVTKRTEQGFAIDKLEKFGAAAIQSATDHKYVPRYPDCKDCGPNRIGIIDTDVLRALILQKFVAQNYVIIGQWGAELLSFGSDSSSSPNSTPFVPPKRILQLISSATIDFDVHALSSFLTQFTTAGIKYKERRISIPKDFRIMRYTIRLLVPSIHGGIKEKPLLDIYNVASYELVPYVSRTVALGSENIQKLKIGAPHSLMRFLMIDLLILRMIGQAEVMAGDVRDRYIAEVLDIARKVREMREISPSVEHFFGINVDYIVAKRLEDRKESNQHPAYLPELALKSGRYKTVY